MKLLLLFILSFNFNYSQELKEVNEKLLIPDKIDNELEYRVYHSGFLSEYIYLYRVYKNDKKEWVEEQFKYSKYRKEGNPYEIAINEIDTISGELSETFHMQIRNDRKYLNKYEKKWDKIISTKILDVKNIENEIKNDQNYYAIMDGEYYVIQINNKLKYNEIRISNPKHYFSIVKENESLNSLIKFLQKVEEQFLLN